MERSMSDFFLQRADGGCESAEELNRIHSGAAA